MATAKRQVDGCGEISSPNKLEKWNPTEIVGKYVNNFPVFFGD